MSLTDNLWPARIGHILYLDIVGFSRLSIADQRRQLDRLNSVAVDCDTFQAHKAREALLIIPSGDGMALVFTDDVTAPARCALEIVRELKAGMPRVPVRMGIHSGLVQPHRDLIGRENLVGEGINIAHRVMECAGEGDILVSGEHAHWLNALEGWQERMTHLGTAVVKHGVSLDLFALTEGDQESQQSVELPGQASRTTEPPAVKNVSALALSDRQNTAPSVAGKPVLLSGLNIRLFGPFEITRNGIELPRPRSRMEHWLLAILVLRDGKALDRTWLAGTLWPDSLESQALSNLRRSLSNLRTVLGEDAFRLISPSTMTIGFDLSEVRVDVREFDKAIKRRDAESLEQAVHLYRGPLLEACTEEWVLQERERCAQSHMAALGLLAEQALANRDYAAAERYLRQELAIDPLRETAQRALLRTLAEAGDIPTATAAYREFRLLLHRELQSEPSAETTALYRAIRETPRAAPPVSTRRSETSGDTSPPPVGFLPNPATPLLGREDAVKAIQNRLTQARLVTITGMGGFGKTRLAIAVAERVRTDFPDGVWFVDLAPLTDPALVPRTIASVLGIRQEADGNLVELICNRLRRSALLLVMDNCEQVLDASAQCVHAVQSLCPGVQCLATSREPLGVHGEVNWIAPPLPVPEREPSDSSVTNIPVFLETYPAVRLFVERATAAQSTFQATARNLTTITEICRRLDGIPLAIELAAARIKVLSPEQLEQRLDARFSLLTGGNRTAMPRHQTLQAAIDWSYDLLAPKERLLFRRLAVLAGAWTLEAAEAVCVDADSGSDLSRIQPLASAPADAIQTQDVLDLLTLLIEKSLILMIEDEDEARFRMLETVREYARNQLIASGEGVLLEERLLAYCLQCAEEAEPYLTGPDKAFWLQRLERDHDNLRAALEGSVATSRRSEDRLRLAVALWRFWEDQGHHREGAERLMALLRQASSCSPERRTQALYAAGCLFASVGDTLHSGPLFEEALQWVRVEGDRGREAEILYQLGVVARDNGDIQTAVTRLTESLQFARDGGDWKVTASVLNILGNIARDQQDYPKALQYQQENFELSREQQDAHGMALALRASGAIAFLQGDYREATTRYHQSLELFRAQNSRWGIGAVLNSLGRLATAQGALTDAQQLLRESLKIRWESKDLWGVMDGLAALAVPGALQQRYEQAVQGIAAAEQVRQELGCSLSEREREEREVCLQAARAALGDSGYLTAWEQGESLSAAQAVQSALASVPDL